MGRAPLTWDAVESRKLKAVRFVRDVLGDAGRASEIEDESAFSYAARRKWQIANPKERTKMAKTKGQLVQELAEVNKECDELVEEFEDFKDKLVALIGFEEDDEAEDDEEEDDEAEDDGDNPDE